MATEPARGLDLAGALGACRIPGLTAPADALVDADVDRALAEDLGDGDLSAALLPARSARAQIRVREDAVLCGLPWALRCFAALDPQARFELAARDGDAVAQEQVLLTIDADVRALVSAERCALNFLQTLSGTATVTSDYVQALAGSRSRLLDTRKTLPGLRLAQKYAVRAGGGDNHRAGLYDAVLIKENHIAAAGSIAAAVSRARELGGGRFIEVEVEDLAELEQALAAGAPRIMLDEFSHQDIVRAVAITAGRAALEVSGSMDLERMATVAQLGVDHVSVGALTKHVRAIDLSMRLVAEG
ncbi:MAG: carboxylating nicotinate-nucleotide diphosphorylase [Xanthomonadales bacterium]|nr:carboxylating nicotinate-nucleotide diphosphorylase [Xanthomonadales bacterium]